MNIAFNVAFSLMVSTFIACCITMRWVAHKGEARLVVGGVIALGCACSERQWHGGVITIMSGCSDMSLFGIGWNLLIKGAPPGVLF